MNAIVNFAMRVMGLGKAVEALDSESSKAYSAAVGKMFLGASSCLGGLAGLISEFVAAHGGAAYLALIQGLATDPSAILIGAGIGLILTGWGDIGQRHATAVAAKAAAEAAKASAITPAPVPPVVP
jgi:hypothetical protein